MTFYPWQTNKTKQAIANTDLQVFYQLPAGEWRPTRTDLFVCIPHIGGTILYKAILIVSITFQ